MANWFRQMGRRAALGVVAASLASVTLQSIGERRVAAPEAVIWLFIVPIGAILGLLMGGMVRRGPSGYRLAVALFTALFVLGVGLLSGLRGFRNWPMEVGAALFWSLTYAGAFIGIIEACRRQFEVDLVS